MSAQEYLDACKYITEKEHKLISDLYMSGINHDCHVWVTFGNVEKVIGKIILWRTKDTKGSKEANEICNAIEFERKWLCDAGHTSKDIDIALNAIKSRVKDVLEKGAEG